MILIAERDQNVRELQRYFLDRAGYTVEFALDGQSALARARQLLPKLVITEILLPKLDGLTVCRRLQEDPVTRDIPVLIFSILAAAARAQEAGARAYLRKPLIESIFIATVEQLTAATPPVMMEQQWASR